MSGADKADYLAENAHVAEAARAVCAMLSELQTMMQKLETGTVEIEGRLGRFGPSGFNPDIGSSAFCSIVSMLESYQGWSRVSSWEEIQDVFFSTTLPAGALPSEEDGHPVQVRTSVGGSGTMEVVHIVKKKLRRVDMNLQNVDVGACAIGTQACDHADYPLDARVAISVEWPISTESLPIVVLRPDLVRIKQRRRFFLSSSEIPGDCFCFEVTIVYRGKTKTEAEAKQCAGEGASFEVECECLAPNAYIRKCGGDPLCLALSIVVKLLDFASALNPTSCVTFVPVPSTRRGGGRSIHLGRS